MCSACGALADVAQLPEPALLLLPVLSPQHRQRRATRTCTFSSHINVTITLGGPPTGADYFWTILRGRTRAPMLLPGGSAPEPLPRTARLRSYEEAANRSAVPYQSVALFNASSAATSGAAAMTGRGRGKC